MNFYVHLDGNRFTVQTGRFVFPLPDRFQCRTDQQCGSAHNMGLHDISLFVDDRFNDYDAFDLAALARAGYFSSPA